MTKTRGFTLIELMVTLIIVAVLAAIAIPAYRKSVIKGNRRAAQSVMMEIVNREHQYFVANRAYGDEAVLDCGLTPDVDANYDCDIEVDPADVLPAPSFKVTFTATGGQASDGNLSVTSQGDKSPADKW
ncbi:MAG TPA: type IV pilin protein [Vicinamibacterales bacterium]|nr:type IV pilin protein [Vicinamibacterales bacterium]